MSEQPTEAMSLASIVQSADDMVGAARIRTGLDLNDPITALNAHCKAFIEGNSMNQHTRTMALVKCDEMTFWLRAGAGKG